MVPSLNNGSRIVFAMCVTSLIAPHNFLGSNLALLNTSFSYGFLNIFNELLQQLRYFLNVILSISLFGEVFSFLYIGS